MDIEKVILLSVIRHGEQADIEELSGLVEALGYRVVDSVVQRRRSFVPSTYAGKGKIEELKRLAEEKDASLIVAYHNLSPSQVRNIERITGLKVRDRTEIILEIFAERARTKEAKIQVELAKCYHQLSRLRGKGKELSRLGGGIGTRGPGETILETESRAIRQRVHFLKREIEKYSKRRSLFTERRKRSGLVTVAVAGYTNVGKSTLVRRLTGEEVFIKDIPFATLDTRTGRIFLKSINKKVLITDTVGFIKDIPHELIASFKATLQEVTNSNIVVVVYDITSSNLESESDAVENILKEIGASEKPRITVFNKIDLVEGDEETFRLIVAGRVKRCENPVFLSAKTGEGVGRFLKKIEKMIKNLSF
ncbi:GTPase HflX [Desulfurobacterium sp. TC5-1]|uniref:GTPase HflX n=1 Tax=Desulfurobacterium sp. TC5-1 TaxID=1158318 RepID=UPI0003B36884|nr:GTPase HflX [Desulfurobacterium sp. TC5-1]